MPAAVKAGRGARLCCNPSGIRRVAYPIDSTWRAFCAHSSPERACAATTPNRNGRAVLGNRRIFRLCCRWRRRRRAVRVIVVVTAPTARTASPRAPHKEPEEEEPDQQDPEQAEEREEAEPASVITRIDKPTVSARCRHDLRRLARVIGDQADYGRDRRRDETPDPEKTEASIHFAQTSLNICPYHADHL